MAKAKSKAPRVATTRKGTPAAGSGIIDATLKKRWEAARERYRRARTGEMEGWDERFEALGEIIDEELYLAGGFKTVRAFLAAEAPDLDERSARRYIRVARYFDPEDEERYGPTKLDLVLEYLEAAGGAPLIPAKIRLDKQTIPVRRGDDKEAKKLALVEATAAELKTAVRSAKRGGVGAPAARTSPLVKAVAAGLKKARLGDIAVSVRGDRLTLSNIAPADLGKLAKALAAVKPPAPR